MYVCTYAKRHDIDFGAANLATFHVDLAPQPTVERAQTGLASSVLKAYLPPSVPYILPLAS